MKKPEKKHTYSIPFKGIMLLLGFLTTCIAGVTASNAGLNKNHVRNYDIPVGQFHSFSVDDNVNVVYRCVEDSAGRVSYKGDDRFDNAFIFNVNNGHLRIQVNTEDVNDPELPVLYIYSEYLTKVSNSSDFNVTVESVSPTPRLDIIQIGNGSINVENIKATKVTGKINTGHGDIVLSGKCNNACLTIVGTGTIQADRLKSETVDCKIMGGGTIGCWPEENLNIRGIGSTKIYYKGQPKVNKKGGGHAIPLDTTNPKEIYLP